MSRTTPGNRTDATTSGDGGRERHIARKLAEIAQTLATTPGLTAVAQVIVAGARELLQARYATLFDIDPRSRATTVVAVAGILDTAFVPGFRLPEGAGVVGVAIRTGATVTTSDLLTDPRVILPDGLRRALEAAPFRSVLATPLVAHGAVVGALAVCDRQDREFSADDVALAHAFSAQAAVGIATALLFDESERRRREAETLATLARSLSEDLDADRAARRVVDAACELLDVASAALYRRDEASGAMQLAVEAHRSPASPQWPAEIPDGHGIVGTSAAERRIVTSANVLDDPAVTLTGAMRRALDSIGRWAGLAVPLPRGDDIAGVLAVGDVPGRSFTDDDVRLARAFGDHAAIALNNARLHTAAVRSGEERTALLRATHTVMSGLDLETTLGRILTEASAIAGTPHVKILLKDPSRPLLRLAASMGRPVPAGFTVPVGQRYSGQVAATGRPVYVEDLRQDPDNPWRDRDRQLGIVTYLGLPVIRGDEVLGVLSFNTTEPRRYTSQELDVLASFADQAALAIHNASVYARADRDRHVAEVLASLTRSINDSLELDTVLERIADAARELCDGDAVRIALADDSGVMRLRCSSGPPGAECTDTSIAACDTAAGVVETRRPLCTATHLVVPILSRDVVKGLLCLGNESPRPFTDRDEAIVTRLADHAAIAIQNAELFAAEQAARRAAEASQRHYRELFDDVPVGLFRTATDGTILAANRTLAVILGYPDGPSLYGMNATSFFVDPRERDRWRTAIEGADAVQTAEVQRRRGDGSAVWVRLRARALRDPHGRIVGYQGSLEDIDDVRLAEDAHRRTAAQFRAAMENFPFDFWVCDVDGRYILVNPSAMQWGDLLGKRPGEVDLPDDVTRRWTENHARVLAGDIVQGEVEYVLGGRRRACYHVIAPVRVGERIAGLVGINLDITARKEAEQALRESEEQVRQLQKMEALGRLAAGVAHDFNNLLTVISGRADILLRRESQSPAVRANAGLIRETTKRAADLTRQLLAFSRKQVLDPRVINVNDTVAGAEKILRRLIGEDVALTIALDPEAGSVVADPAQLVQVIFNLVVNSRDAMPGGGRLGIRTHAVTVDRGLTRRLHVQPGPHVALCVEDTGCGMDAATRDRIFEPFFTTKGPERGTGLGLSTVFGVVRQSGGDVHVQSEVGVGTTFTIYLPCAGETAGDEGAPAAATRRRGTETILLVEDERDVRDVAVEMLEEAGYSVLVAANAEEALRLADTGDVDLLLTDVIMPGMNGGELAAEFFDRRPGSRLLFASGYTDDVLAHRGLLRARVPLLRKPYSMDELLGKVREVLDARAT